MPLPNLSSEASPLTKLGGKDLQLSIQFHEEAKQNQEPEIKLRLKSQKRKKANDEAGGCGSGIL